MGWDRELSRAAQASLWALAALITASTARADASESTPTEQVHAELSAEERALLRDLDLLLELELLRDWDPAADLPIPADPVQANAVDPEEAP